MSAAITFKLNGLVAIRHGETLRLVVGVPGSDTTFTTAVELPETQPNELLLIREITIRPVAIEDVTS